MAKTTTTRYLKIMSLIDELNQEIQGYGYSLHCKVDTLNDDVLISVNSTGFFKEEMTLERALNFENPAEQSDANVIGDIENKFNKVEDKFFKEVEI